MRGRVDMGGGVGASYRPEVSAARCSKHLLAHTASQCGRQRPEPRGLDVEAAVGANAVAATVEAHERGLEVVQLARVALQERSAHVRMLDRNRLVAGVADLACDGARARIGLGRELARELRLQLGEPLRQLGAQHGRAVVVQFGRSIGESSIVSVRRPSRRQGDARARVVPDAALLALPSNGAGAGNGDCSLAPATYKEDSVATKRKTQGAGARGSRSESIANRGVYGEGNYRASREYNEATREFVRSGRVAGAARRSAPASGREAASLERAEQAGKSRARGEDPQVAGPRSRRANRERPAAGRRTREK